MISLRLLGTRSPCLAQPRFVRRPYHGTRRQELLLDIIHFCLGRLPAVTSQDTYSLAYTAIGEGFTGGGRSIPASEEDLWYAVQFWNLSQELLESAKMKAAPVQVGHGLEGVLDGLQALKENKVSGKKLVYKV